MNGKFRLKSLKSSKDFRPNYRHMISTHTISKSFQLGSQTQTPILYTPNHKQGIMSANVSHVIPAGISAKFRLK